MKLVLGIVFALFAAPAMGASALSITLAPRGGTGQVETVDITLEFEEISAAEDGALLEMPLISSNVDTVATVLSHLQASDDLGALTLSATDRTLSVRAAGDAEIGGLSRVWSADRDISGNLIVRYAMPADATLPARGGAPPFAFSNDGNATSAAGHIFLMLPPGDAAYETSVRWDLSGLPEGAKGVSSFGSGAASAPEPLKASQLRMTFFMAGDIGVWPYPTPETGFFSAWQGDPPFKPRPLMKWTRDLYGQYAQFFEQDAPPPYGVFLRYNPVNAGGGVGLYHSFVTTFGKAGGQGSDVAELKITLAHEMFHTFSPFIEEPAGLESSWFGEGLATLYMRKLPFRFGLLTMDEFLENLNFHAGRYYTNILAGEPNSEVPKRFWEDTRIRTLPYDRGMLYFADLDHKIRKRSDGKRSLDDLVLAMLEKEAAGTILANKDWVAVLRAELGAGAVEDFRAFLMGEEPLPASDAFGSCFRRITKPLRRYELGFDPSVLRETRRIVRGLAPGSAAAQAGLRNGDEIVFPVPQDKIQGDQDLELELRIRRDGEEFDLSYLPRGETVEAYQWEKTSGSDPEACRF
ncbi:peptidase M61 [Hyphococcus sp.]|uniref:peptidase M61 n=1 Tax=Hyphococcus sp. TaxID=2038636 RepID=UPI0035C77632